MWSGEGGYHFLASCDHPSFFSIICFANTSTGQAEAEQYAAGKSIDWWRRPSMWNYSCTSTAGTRIKELYIILPFRGLTNHAVVHVPACLLSPSCNVMLFLPFLKFVFRTWSHSPSTYLGTDIFLAMRVRKHVQKVLCMYNYFIIKTDVSCKVAAWICEWEIFF